MAKPSEEVCLDVFPMHTMRLSKDGGHGRHESYRSISFTSHAVLQMGQFTAAYGLLLAGNVDPDCAADVQSMQASYVGPNGEWPGSVAFGVKERNQTRSRLQFLARRAFFARRQAALRRLAGQQEPGQAQQVAAPFCAGNSEPRSLGVGRGGAGHCWSKRRLEIT